MPNLIAERYRLVGQLGQGGMGRVWAARDELLARDVAIKELTPPPGLTEPEMVALRERAIREARSIAMLDQPNVVRIFDVVFQNGDPWIVMALVPSRSLFDTVRDDGPMAPDKVARVGLGILAAHRVGLLHRDVKPGNVLLAHDGRVVLTDFGLATAAGDSSITRTGVVLGSPQYLAPERALDGEVGPAADLWSLGATLYAAVEGRPPYVRSSPMTTLAALATELPDPPERAGVLRHALTALLQRDPGRRADAETAHRLLLAATVPGSPPPADVPAYAEPTFAASMKPGISARPAAPGQVIPPAQVTPPAQVAPVGQVASPAQVTPAAQVTPSAQAVPAAPMTPSAHVSPPGIAAPAGTVPPVASASPIGPASAGGAVSPAGQVVPVPAGPSESSGALTVENSAQGSKRQGPIAVGIAVAALLIAGGAVAYPLLSKPETSTTQAVPSVSFLSLPGEAAGAGTQLPPAKPSKSGRPRRNPSANVPSAGASAAVKGSKKPSAGTSSGATGPVTAAPTTEAAAAGTPFESKGTGTCLHAPSTTGAVQSYTCNGSAGQRFTVASDKTLRVRGKCVQVGGTDDGAGLRLATCTGIKAQQWNYNTSFDLVSLWGIKCVDIPDASTSNGIAVQVWECNGKSHQKWDHSE
ncbi:serine/threonine protein kinase [Actinoplanes couchii]|uniref:non-specific serine/threonine protein kinase n=1 Tax=Actinoplanes couchii TaxID=403638 RepID=A0ABQ3XU09_9ACTN|nr:serine/threonine protein kinase [Actinoplanes couchii]MDR6317772.1 hypothetical protein [Actinoplanes couchii]GID61940.1 hypothetical protein Aco03nite_103440 [Actinoplanes couchii]